MTITIAGTKLAIRKPADLDAALIAATGCSAAENLAMVNGTPHAARLAPAILPFLAEPPALSDLAVLVATDLATPGSTLVADVQKLYAPVEPAPTVATPPPPPVTGTTANKGS